MSYNLASIPLFQALKTAKNILIAGAGGGFDIFSGLPLFWSLLNANRNIILANFSFTWLDQTNSKAVFPGCYAIEAGDRDLSGRNYFPEKHLKLWLEMKGQSTDVYAFQRMGIIPLRAAYKYLIKTHEIDTIILIDGGTDSLMFGDEEGLGTPVEDICSMVGAHRSGAKRQYLVNIGFGVDHFHGVSHYRYLENVATLIKTEGYLGTFQLLQSMPEGQQFLKLVQFVNERMPDKRSIVANSIASSLEGEYGNHHRTNRTQNSELWINPLMSLYWAFDLRKVIAQIKYYDLIKDTKSMGELNGYLSVYRSKLAGFRDKKQIPI